MEKEILIITESKKLFIEKGISNTSIDDIAKACKISKATFYKHFESKETLIEAILQYYRNNLLNLCKNIDSNFEIDPTEKLKEKIIAIWEYKYENFDFSSYVSKVFSKNNEEIKKLQRIGRATIINEYRKNLLTAYGYKIKDILWDVIFIIDGLIYECLMFMRNSNNDFSSEFVANFILNIIENTMGSLHNKKPYMTKNILYGLDNDEDLLTYEECEAFFNERLIEIETTIKENSSIKNKEKFLKALSNIKEEALNKSYHSLTMDAMIAFIATEKSLSDKTYSLNKLKERLGAHTNE